MKVILAKDVAKVGRRGEIRELADGYARNFIIARGLGHPATPENIKKLTNEQTQRQILTTQQRAELLKNLELLNKQKVAITARANERGHLFAAIHEAEIIETLDKQSNGKIHLTPGQLELRIPLKEVGEFEIRVRVGEETGSFILQVLPQH